ncbi:MAG TPA: hypothetical protein VEK80_05990 [Kribbellaceae bacterium]|nr:hypothetical protein [Kribbellaceae bacterium]
MGHRGSRRRARATTLAVAYALSVVIAVCVGFAFFAHSPWTLRGIAVGTFLGGLVTMLLVQHQLMLERSAHGEERARVAQEYSRITNARVVENAEFIDSVHRRVDQIEGEVEAVMQAADRYTTEDAPTVVDLKLRAATAS